MRYDSQVLKLRFSHTDGVKLHSPSGVAAQRRTLWYDDVECLIHPERMKLWDAVVLPFQGLVRGVGRIPGVRRCAAAPGCGISRFQRENQTTVYLRFVHPYGSTCPMERESARSSRTGRNLAAPFSPE